MPPIQLSLIGDVALCFNVDDYMSIRTEQRITGKLVGNTVKWPRNSNLNGLPALFSPYETQLLIDKGIVQLCRKNFTVPIADNIKLAYQHLIDENLKTFQNIYCDKKIEEVKKILPKIMDGKRKKAEKSGTNPNTITEETILNDVRANCNYDSTNILTQIPTQDPFDADFEIVNNAPNLNPLKYRVYCDLWEKGHWLTSGERFGGDFLIYPGEPLYFHASHIVHVLRNDESKSMSCTTFSTRVRLSVNVNKLCIFVYEHETTNELCYHTTQWLGK